MDRRQFLKGLLATLAATAVLRDGVLQPDPERRVFDMGDGWAAWRMKHLAGTDHKWEWTMAFPEGLWIEDWTGFDDRVKALNDVVRSAHSASAAFAELVRGIERMPEFLEATYRISIDPLPPLNF